MVVFVAHRYLQVHTAVPSDGGVLQKLGETFNRIGDRQQAFQYYSDVSETKQTSCIIQLVMKLYGNVCLLRSLIAIIHPIWKSSVGWRPISRRCTFRRRLSLSSREQARCVPTSPNGRWPWPRVLSGSATITKHCRSLRALALGSLTALNVNVVCINHTQFLELITLTSRAHTDKKIRLMYLSFLSRRLAFTSPAVYGPQPERSWRLCGWTSQIGARTKRSGRRRQ